MRFGLDREQWYMVLALLLVAVIAAMLLGLTDMFTRGPIQAAQKKALHQALEQVLPPHANDPQAEQLRMQGEDGAVLIYPGRDGNGRLTGLAWEVVAPDGYSGSIRILLGLEPDGRIHAIRVTNHRETPGLGDGIVHDHAWLASFVGRALSGTRWAVKKDGGDFDQFTGATITPRAVVRAVKRGLEFYRGHRRMLLDALVDADRKRHGGGQ